jgi:hypothetical protein
MFLSDFDLRTALQTFGLTVQRDIDLFASVAPLETSEFLRTWLDEFGPVALGVNSEKARSVFLITPILVEARRRSAGPMNVLPGVTLDVDRSRGLSGFCDFVIAGSAEYYFLKGPLVAVVEAKREDLIGGLGQCAASMVAIREFNVSDGTPVDVVYGAVTSGSIWRFLKLSGSVLGIDPHEYYLHESGKIVAILVHMAGNGVRTP